MFFWEGDIYADTRTAWVWHKLEVTYGVCDRVWGLNQSRNIVIINYTQATGKITVAWEILIPTAMNSQTLDAGKLAQPCLEINSENVCFPSDSGSSTLVFQNTWIKITFGLRKVSVSRSPLFPACQVSFKFCKENLLTECYITDPCFIDDFL